MDIVIRRKGDIGKYSQLRQGDTFILPKGETVYIKLQEMRHFSNIPGNHPSVNLANGNTYSSFRGKNIIKVECQLIATEI